MNTHSGHTISQNGQAFKALPRLIYLSVFACAGITVGCQSTTAQNAQTTFQEATCPVIGVRTSKVYYTRADNGYSAVLTAEKPVGQSENRDCFRTADAAEGSGYKHITKHVSSTSPAAKSKARNTKLPSESATTVPENEPVQSSSTAPVAPEVSADAAATITAPSTTGAASSENVNPNADNTQVNKTQNGIVGASAEQQSNTKGDVEVTRKIRRSLTSDSSFSVYAQNVKIITSQGQVVLKGPVRSANEKAAVEQKAAAVAGAEHVRSELEVVPR